MKDILIRKMGIIFKTLIILFFSISITNAELLKPNSNIKPSKVVKIQLDISNEEAKKIVEKNDII